MNNTKVNAFIAKENLPDSVHSDEEKLITHALSLLEKAASFSVVPISGFSVGAVVIDEMNNFYLGANQEYEAALAQTVHAEQSAISHAWVRGAEKIRHVIVNYTPCGHCRQFMNELANTQSLKIHLPHSRNNLLSDYLPDSFGPSDLEIPQRIFSPNTTNLVPKKAIQSELEKQAMLMAEKSHAPYSHAYAGVALQSKDGQIFTGAYLENAAFNPSLPPLQMALNGLHLSGKTASDIVGGCLVCVPNKGHENHTQNLWSVITSSPLEIVPVQVAG